MSHPTSCAFCFRSPCTWQRNPLIDGGGSEAALPVAIRGCAVPATVGRTTATPPPACHSATARSSGYSIPIVLVSILHTVRPERGREFAVLTFRSPGGALCHAQS